MRRRVVVSKCGAPWEQDKSSSYSQWTDMAALADLPTVAFQRCGMSLRGSINTPDFSLDGKPVRGGGKAFLALGWEESAMLEKGISPSDRA